MPSPASTSTDREAAARIAAEIADRLTDPGRVAAVASASDNLMRYPGAPQPVWHPQSLSDGHPAIALLHTEPHRPAAQVHAHLSAALVAAATAENGWWITDGLDHGLPEHLNLGLAHGISGPFALLALAWRAGTPRPSSGSRRC